jgi:hypothetical protein
MFCDRSARRLALAAGALLALLTVTACAPEVGSARWCEQMRAKPRGDWTANEVLDFARHCIIE